MSSSNSTGLRSACVRIWPLWPLRAATAGETEVTQSLLSGQSPAQPAAKLKSRWKACHRSAWFAGYRTGSAKDVVLRAGDELIIPKQRQEVTVIGEVQSAGSYLFASDFKRNEYIAMSGGMTRKADGKRIYVVRADGGGGYSCGFGIFPQFRRSDSSLETP